MLPEIGCGEAMRVMLLFLFFILFVGVEVWELECFNSSTTASD